MKNPAKLWLGTLTVLLLALTPSVVPVGGSVAPATAVAVGSGPCAQTVDDASGVVVASLDSDSDSLDDACVISFAPTGLTADKDYTWTPPDGVSDVWLLAVAGGGAGGTDEGGGGGAGLFVEYSTLDISSHISGGTVDIQVGKGGVGRYWDGSNYRDKITDVIVSEEPGPNGGDSTFGTITADGGGGGGTAHNSISAHRDGQDGGSGGGGAGESGMGGSRGDTTASGDYEFGNLGGNGGAANGIGGGGGGAGSRGLVDEAGSAKSSAITGSSINYAAGGGGGRGNSSSSPIMPGGSSIGGSGGNNTTEATDGQDGTGSGGGGSGDAPSGGRSFVAGDGGDGIVIVRYSLTPEPPSSTSVASGDGEMTLSYTAPTHWGGGTLSLEYTTDGGSNWRDLGETDGNTTVSLESDGTALQNNTLYTVKLRSKNNVGSGYTSSEVTVGDVIPSAVGEILRLDGTNPTSYGGSGSTWSDISGESNSGTISGATWDSRSKGFAFDGADDDVTLSTSTYDFSDGFALHVVADFGDDADNWERLVDFGNGSGSDNFWFGRYQTSGDIAFETFTGSTSNGYCKTTTGSAIGSGVHTYSVVVSSDGDCALYRDGTLLITVADYTLPTNVARTSNFVAKSNWSADADFEGSIQSVVMYNTAQTTPVCKPVESTFTGDGSIGEDNVPYKVLQFTTVGKCNWSIPSGVVSADAVIVAGGGGGGAWTGAGGGAGGVQAHGDVFTSLTSTSGLTLSGTDYDITVGYGGTGAQFSGTSTFTPGSNGGDSSIGSTWTAYGGGVGGSWPDGSTTTQRPNAGDLTVGSGGGATNGSDAEGSGNSTSFTATGGRGLAGGDGTGSGQPHGSGGGGGAGTIGADASSSTTSGAGGDGVEFNIAGSDTWFAGGGGGGIHGTGAGGSDGVVGAGGSGGGGAGSGPNRTDWTGSNSGNTPVGQMGLSGSGGGGGGSGAPSSTGYSSTGGAGGSGIVVVRYSLSPAAPSISSVSSGDASIDVAFTAPSHTGGAAITDYEYSFDGSTWTSFGTASAGTETISGLTNGTAYTPRIRAVNANGNGLPVTAGSATTPRGSQTLSWSPTNTTVEVTDGSVTLDPAASALGGVTIEYSVQTAGDPSCAVADDATPTVTFSATGTCVIRATALEGGAYLAATTDVTLTVTTAAQTITFAAVNDKNYGDSSFSLTVSASSSLTVTVTPADTSVCTVSGATVSIVSAGTCSLVASQSGDSDYAAASTVTRSFTVSPKAITMSVSIADKNYDGLSSATVSGTPTLSGVVSGDANYVAVDTAEITAAFADPDAGAGKSVSVTLGDDVLAAGSSGDRSDSYTVTLASTPTATISKISQATLSLTSASSMVFGQSIPLVATGGSGSGALSYSKVSGPCTVTGSTVTSTGAGSCVVSATREADTNYNSVSSSNFTITVAKANQSINFTSSVPVSAVSGTTYTPAATATSGLTPSFSITTGNGTVCSLSSGVVTFLTSGTCVITAAQSGDSDYNAASSVTQTIVAGKINQTITFPAITGKDFDDPAFSAGASVSSGRTVTYATSTSAVCSVNASTGVVSIETVGECTVTASSAGDSSYAAASDVSRTFTISPVVAGKPSITSVSFGDSSVTAAFVAPGFVGGDAIDGYQVVATSSGGSVTKPDCSTTSPCTITGLTNGESYTLTVAAINAAGVGSASDASPSIIPARIADAVSGLATTPGDEELAVSWTALTTDQLGGGSFTRYDVYLRVNGGSWGSAVTPDGTNNLATRTTTSYTFTGLTNGTAYDVKIVAITSVNSTALSSNTSTALGVPATVPSAVSGLTATALSNTTAVASWSAPLDDGGSAITAYSVNLSCTFVNSTDTFCELSGLTAGSTVTVSAGATNLMGTGSTVSVSITMPGGSSGGSGGGSSGSQAVAAATDVPVVVPRRVIVPVQPTPVPRLLAAPVRIIPERGFDPDAGAKARVGGQPATVTKKPLGEGGLSVGVGAFQLGIKLSTPGSSEPSAAGQRSDIDVPTGESTKVSGGGLLPGSSLQVWLPGVTGESPRELARIPVQSDGSFASELSFTSRQSDTPIPIGPQVMQVTGYDEQGNQTIVDMVVNIGQGAPAPEFNRVVNELPELSPGESLATSAGTPETVRVEAAPQTGEVAVLSEEWAFTVAVAEDSGGVERADAGATITMVQTKTATVSGEGFQPDTRVDIWLFSDPTLLGSVIVAADGSFTGEVYMDARFATPGEHTLQLQGVADDGFIKAANLGVVVQEPVEFTTENASGLLWWVVGVFLLAVLVMVLLLARRRRGA